jgi:ATP-dependent RNA helicase RhlE
MSCGTITACALCRRRVPHMIDPNPAVTFAALGLRPELLKVVDSAGYSTPTPVQAAVIAQVLAGRDVLARAETGSGKTAAFGLPILQRLLEQPRARSARGNKLAVLVLAPTRELVMQLAAVLSDYARSLPTRLKIAAVFGGVAINPQMMAMRGGADILVATPGRLLDLQRQGAVEFDQLRALILDEADRMLSLGFRAELDQVLTLLPTRRQNLCFSATFPDAVERWTRALLHEPHEVDIKRSGGTPASGPERAMPPGIDQHVYVVDETRKAALLIQLLQKAELHQVLIFVSIKKTADKLADKLTRASIAATVFHADKSQHQRTQALDGFRAGKLRVLIATDLAARGIDIDDLPAVLNYELPRSPNDYLHRIGRTGRAGKPGLALTLICASDEQHFRVIEKRIKQRLPREHVAGFEPKL